MIRTLNLTADIPANRELHISLPADLPEGPAEIVLVISPLRSELSALASLRDSEFFGIWRDRADIGDTIEFTRNLRSETWKRNA